MTYVSPLIHYQQTNKPPLSANGLVLNNPLKHYYTIHVLLIRNVLIDFLLCSSPYSLTSQTFLIKIYTPILIVTQFMYHWTVTGFNGTCLKLLSQSGARL